MSISISPFLQEPSFTLSRILRQPVEAFTSKSSMDKNLENVLNKMSLISVEIASINERLNRGLGQLATVEKKSEGIDKAMMVIPTVESLRCMIADMRTEFVGKNDELHRRLIALSAVFGNFNDDLKDLKDRVASMSNDLERIRVDYKHDHDNLEDLIVHLNGKSNSELQSRLENLQKNLVVSPKDIASQNETLLKRIEAASMDGNNAMMNVNAQDLNLKILDKKIESLSIQIKRLDLTKQLEA